VIRSIEQLTKGRREDRSKAGVRGATVNLELLANAAAMDIIFHKKMKTRPPVIVTDSVIGLKFSRMSGSRMVMEGVDNIAL
jgi:hypothetical protein